MSSKQSTIIVLYKILVQYKILEKSGKAIRPFLNTSGFVNYSMANILVDEYMMR